MTRQQRLRDLLTAISDYRAAAPADRHRTRRNALGALAEWRTLVERPERAAFERAVERSKQPGRIAA